MNFASPKKLFIGASVWLLVASAYGAPTLYSFSAGGTPFSQFPEFLGSSISGTFMYDPAAPVTFTLPPGGAFANASIYGPFPVPGGLHSSYTALNATVSGGNLGASSFSFSDPIGSIIVSNDVGPSLPPADFFSLDADPFGPSGRHDIVPFTFGDHTLWNMRMFWGEGQLNPDTVPDFLNDQSLPEVLPSMQARLVLDFIPTGSTTGSPLSFIFFERLMVTPISSIAEPATYGLMLTGFGVLAFGLRRRNSRIVSA
jgi:hypothetical protein